MEQKKPLKSLGFLMLTLLALEYLTGMYSNLFVEFPEEKIPHKLWASVWHSAPLSAHIILSTALIVVALGIIAFTIKQKNKKWIIASSIGALSIMIAGATGSAFVSSQKEVLSYIMSISFLCAFASYSWGLFS